MLVAAFLKFCPMIVRNVLPGAILSLPEFITYFITYVNIHQKKKMEFHKKWIIIQDTKHIFNAIP